jgi:ATP-dependent DNA helicase RecQ
VLSGFDGRARAACRASAGEAERARWRQYRSIWEFVEGDRCRRAAILRHFGDPSAPRALDGVPCCDVCAPEGAIPEGAREPARPGRASPSAAAAAGDLEAAIVEVVNGAEPAVGRTRTVEILRGGRSKLIQKNSYDGLPAYGAFSHLRADEVLEHVDALIERGTLRSTGGAYPKLVAAGPALDGVAAA